MAPPLKRRQPGSSGSSSSTWLFLWGAGLALLVAAMAGVATVPLKPEVAVGEDEYKPPVPLDEVGLQMVASSSAATRYQIPIHPTTDHGVPPADDALPRPLPLLPHAVGPCRFPGRGVSGRDARVRACLVWIRSSSAWYLV